MHPLLKPSNPNLNNIILETFPASTLYSYIEKSLLLPRSTLKSVKSKLKFRLLYTL